MPIKFSIEKLRREHFVDNFDCGIEDLNRFLVRHALVNQQAASSTTYVGLADQLVIGFYTLIFGQVGYEGAPQRLTKGMARHPVPIMLLARLAVSRVWHGKKIAAALLKDSMRRTLQAADIAGVRAFAVHAKDEKTRAFYRRFNFKPSPMDPHHLYLLIKDIRLIVAD